MSALQTAQNDAQRLIKAIDAQTARGDMGTHTCIPESQEEADLIASLLPEPYRKRVVFMVNVGRMISAAYERKFGKEDRP